LSGATYALNGNVQKVANNIFIFAPENVDVTANKTTKESTSADHLRMFGDRIMIVIMNAVNTFFQIVIYLILGRAILSWFVRNPYGSLIKYILQLSSSLSRFFPLQKAAFQIRHGGTIDFSPILAIIGLTMINGVVINILRMLMF